MDEARQFVEFQMNAVGLMIRRPPTAAVQNFQAQPPIPVRPGRGQGLDGQADAGPTGSPPGRGGTDEQSQTSAGFGRQLQPAKGTIVAAPGNPSQHGGNARLAKQLIECQASSWRAAGRITSSRERADLIGDGRRIERSLGVEHGQHSSAWQAWLAAKRASVVAPLPRSGGQPFHQAAAWQAAAGKHLVEQGRTGADRGQAGGAMAVGAGRRLRPVGPPRRRCWGCGASDCEPWLFRFGTRRVPRVSGD